MNQLQGRNRPFADAISIDAWHAPLGDVERVDLFADVVLGTARIGAEPECPIRFRLSLKRAEIHLLVPEHEPLRIDKASVARVSPELPTQRVIRMERGLEASTALEQTVQGKASLIDPTLKGEEASRRGSKSMDREEIVETCQIKPFRLQCTVSAEGNYRWQVESEAGSALRGSIFPAGARLAEVVDTRSARSGLPPSGIRFEVRCAREDLLIEDIEHKDQRLNKRMKDPQRRLVAIQYIIDELMHLGLDADRVDDPFGRLTLASAVAES